MKIIAKLSYISDNCNWDKFCEITGRDYYWSIENDEEITLSFKQAVQIGLITERRIYAINDLWVVDDNGDIE